MMNKASLVLGTLVLGASLAGCNSSDTSSPYLKSVARNVLIAKAYDSGARAARDNDGPAVQRAADELEKLGADSQAFDMALLAPQSPAEKEVQLAFSLDVRAGNGKGEGAEALRNEASLHYRKALQIQPAFDSRDPMKLNSLGYFLADRGSSQADFIQAESLTRNALAKIEKGISVREKAGVQALLLKSLRPATRDSLAWALYKQGRFTEALQEQEQAVGEMEKEGVKMDPSDELNIHLTKIKEALAETKAGVKQNAPVTKTPVPAAESSSHKPAAGPFADEVREAAEAKSKYPAP